MLKKGEGDPVGKSATAIDAVDAAVVSLMTRDEFSVPTARQISKRSGYSVGTIFNYFKNMDGVFVHVFLKKQASVLRGVIDVIEKHPVDQTGTVLIESLVACLFKEPQIRTPALVRFFVRHFFKTASRPEQFNTAIDALIEPLILARLRDTTGTFPVMEAEELGLLLRAMQAIMRAPLFEQSPFFGTAEHQRLTRDICLRLFHPSA